MQIYGFLSVKRPYYPKCFVGNEWNIAQSETKTAENFADFQSVKKGQTRWPLTAAEAAAEEKFGHGVAHHALAALRYCVSRNTPPDKESTRKSPFRFYIQTLLLCCCHFHCICK